MRGHDGLDHFWEVAEFLGAVEEVVGEHRYLGGLRGTGSIWGER